MITLTTYADCREALRRRDLRQALYDEGDHLMSGVIVNLDGVPHVERRRLENRLFHRDTIAWFERERLGPIVEAVFVEAFRSGRGDVPPLLRRALMWLSLDIAGIDLDLGSSVASSITGAGPGIAAGFRVERHTAAAESSVVGRAGDPSGRQRGLVAPASIERLAGLMGRMSRAATVAHATGDKAAIVADGDAALASFDEEFYRPSLARREALVERVRRGELPTSDLPRDVLTTLLFNEDRLDLPAETMLREVAYYPWVGSHSTANQVAHALHHIFEWLGDEPSARERLIVDDDFRLGFVHESLRLHPASPVALREATSEVILRSGQRIAEGKRVAIGIEAANRDADAVGSRPDRFIPFRSLADGVAPWGLSFGHGPHACLGRELAGGVAPGEANDQRILGTISALCRTLLAAGAHPVPDDPPTLDPTTTRAMWGRYPVAFTA